VSDYPGDPFVSPCPLGLTRLLTSRDGTVAGYRQHGSGQGLVLRRGVSGTSARTTSILAQARRHLESHVACRSVALRTKLGIRLSLGS